MDKNVEKAAALAVMKWHGGGSPVGLAIFLISVSILIKVIGFLISR